LRLRTVQLMSDLMGSVSQRLPAASPGQKDEMYDVLRRLASGFSVINDELAKDQNVTQLYKITKNAGVDAVSALCEAVLQAVKKVPEFSKVNQPRTLSAIAPSATTGETTSPTTAP